MNGFIHPFKHALEESSHMANLIIRPDMRTPGGEVNDILLNGQYAGTLTLVYREGDRISGSIQIEKKSVNKDEKDEVIEFAQNYVQSLIDAMKAEECDVLVTYGKYHHVIATDQNVGVIEQFIDDDRFEADYVTEDPRFVDMDEEDLEEVTMNEEEYLEQDGHIEFIDEDEDERDAVYYELVIVGERRNQIEYHVYDKNQKWVAEAVISIYGVDVVGEVDFKHSPDEDEIEMVTDLIVSDFDENEIETFVLDIMAHGEVIETIELTHEDLLDSADTTDTEVDVDSDYSIILTRDDGDTLTYEIYSQKRGGLPIAVATVDISDRQISGFVEFSDLTNDDERESIASALLREVDKEKDYSACSLTMLHNNEPLEELFFENEFIH
jgi:hypothetical protein